MGDVDAWMPLWIADYLGDTSDLSTEEHGAYLLLLMTLWRRGGSMPFDHERLARATQLPPDRWQSAWAALQRFFQVADGQISQRRLLRELGEAQKRREGAREKARKAAAARWQGGQAPASNGAAQDAPSIAQALPEQCPPPSPSPSPDPDPDMRSRKRKRAGGADPDFDAFYEAFPRKRSRGDAEKAWRQTADQRPEFPIVLAAVGRLKGEGRPIDKTPYPATWLRNKGWLDEVKPTPNGVPSTGGMLAEVTRANEGRYQPSQPPRAQIPRGSAR